jgi:hypothetical protein
MDFGGTTLREWVALDSGLTFEAYVTELERGAWGGEIELGIFARYTGLSVRVFESSPGGYRQMCCFAAGSRERGFADVLYQGRRGHYDALVIHPKIAGNPTPCHHDKPSRTSSQLSI